MYGDITNLNQVGYKGGAQASQFRPKRDPELLFSKIKKMSPTLKPLAMALNSGNGGRREWATARLARAGPKADFLLYATIAHGDSMARAAAAEAVCRMVRLGLNNSCTLKLSLALKDEVPYVRWRAFAEISQMGSQSMYFVKHMFNGLHDDSNTVRVYAAKAIIATYRRPRNNYPDDIRELEELSKTEKDPYVRDEIKSALEKVKCEHALFEKQSLRSTKYKG
jgi:HEAT repeat protein